MLKIYGNLQCPDCADCCRDLDNAGVPYDFADIFSSIKIMKEFLHLRDNEPAFEEIKKAGAIGIPCILDGNQITFDWTCYVTQA